MGIERDLQSSLASAAAAGDAAATAEQSPWSDVDVNLNLGLCAGTYQQTVQRDPDESEHRRFRRQSA